MIRIDLKHYGVIGMKWGVRRYQNKDGSLTRLGKRLLDEREAGSNFQRLVKNGGTVSKGTKTYRVIKEGANEIGDTTYVSLSPSQNSRYALEFKTLGARPVKALELEIAKEVKIPSLDETSKILNSVISSKKFADVFEEEAKTMTTFNQQYGMHRNYSLQDYRKLQDISPDISSKYILAAMPMPTKTGEYLRKAIPKAVQEKGYSGLIDLHSTSMASVKKGRDYLTENVMIFDKNSLQISGTEKINNLFLKNASKELKELPYAMNNAEAWLKKQGIK